jgi:hypothetical protein
MNCDCSIDIDNEESPQVYREKIVTAYKTHCCVECGEIITRRSKYQDVSGLWEGRWEHHKTCLTCKTIREEYCSGGFIFGELAEQLYECFGFDYREAG